MSRRIREVLLAASGALAACVSLATRPQPPHQPSRVGTYWYFVENVTPVSSDSTSEAVLLWAALPLERPGQHVRITRIAPPPTELLENGETGDRLVFWRVDSPAAGAQLIFRYDFEVVNTPIVTAIDPDKVRRVQPDSPEARRYTASEGWIELIPEIAAKAREVVGREWNPYRQARLVFDWIVETLTYDYPAIRDRGAGRAFAQRKGDCGEFSHVFIAMMRSLGVPARSVVANWYQGSGHAWAEVYLPPYGWVPVDTSGAQLVKNGLKGQLSEEQVEDFRSTRGIPVSDPVWLFGNLYPHRLEVFVGDEVAFVGRAPGSSRTFRLLQPGGSTAWPPAIELKGLTKQTVHTGFFRFGPDAGDEAQARAQAEEGLADAYLDAGLSERAISGLTRALARKPDDAIKLFELGQAHFNLRQWGEAMRAFERSLTGKGGGLKRTTDTLSHLFLGMCQDALGQRDEAMKEYQAAVASGADYAGSLGTARKYLDKPYSPDAP